MSIQKKGLGKGLCALISNVDYINDIDEKDIVEISIDKVKPNKGQPRKNFSKESLKELSDSIATYGLIQPIVVNKKDDYYEIVAGERRWRAATIAGFSKVPVIIKNYTEQEILEVSLIENIQRENLNPMEEAQSYSRLINEFDLTQEEVSKRVHKSRTVIANTMRLLNLDERVQNLVAENKLTNSHARTLLAIEDGDLQFQLAEEIIKNDYTVRVTESIIKSNTTDFESEIINISKYIPNPIYKEMAERFGQILGTKVKIKNGNKTNKIEIEYYSDDDLNRLFSLVKEISVVE